MLVLTRKVGERIVVDGVTVVEVLQIDGMRVRIGIWAPSEVTILRQELILDRDGAAQPQGNIHRQDERPPDNLP